MNPQFSVPRQIFKKKHLKRRHFVSRPSSEENGSKDYCDVYPGRHDLSSPVISFRMVRHSFTKCVEMPFIRVLGSYNNITHSGKCILYDPAAMIRRLQRKDVKKMGLFCRTRNGEESASLPKLFQIYQLKTYQQFIEMPTNKPEQIFNSI